MSIHGYGREGLWTSLLLGGGNRALADLLAEELSERLPGYEMVTDLDEIPAALRGTNAANPVNVPASGGVQLELPPARPRPLAVQSSTWPRRLLASDRALIDGLAAVAGTWLDRESAA